MLIVLEKRSQFFGGLLPRALAAVALVSVLPLISSAQPSPGVFGPGPGCNLFPAPPSVGATVGLSYFGPPPSETNPSLVGPVQLLKSGQVDTVKGTVTLPLYRVLWLPATGLYGTFCPMSATLRSRRCWD